MRLATRLLTKDLQDWDRIQSRITVHICAADIWRLRGQLGEYGLRRRGPRLGRGVSILERSPIPTAASCISTQLETARRSLVRRDLSEPTMQRQKQQLGDS